MPLDAATRMGLIVARLTYKESWQFVIHSCYNGYGAPTSGLVFGIVHYEPNVMEPSKRVPVTISEGVGRSKIDTMTDLEIVEWVRDMIVKAEMHEVNEWFRFDGRCVHDPHPERHAFEAAPKAWDSRENFARTAERAPEARSQEETS
jgi:hypothetical protein